MVFVPVVVRGLELSRRPSRERMKSNGPFILNILGETPSPHTNTPLSRGHGVSTNKPVLDDSSIALRAGAYQTDFLRDSSRMDL
jgi:hypothetical protein